MIRSFRSSKRRQAGLGLLEVLLAITVSLVIGAIAADQLRSSNDTKQAQAAGDQLRSVGNALNTYLALRYDQIVNLTNVGNSCPAINNTSDISMMGTANDPGPRCCTQVGGVGYCLVNSDTLRRNGLLPNSFSGYNAYGAQYNYIIRVQGAAPNYIVDGLVFTNQSYTTTGTTPRYDLLGVAMQEAGADSGMTRSVQNRMEGLNGAWSDSTWMTTGAWSGPNTLGLLGYRVGYGTSGFAAYLRLDGASAMTGDLDMGGHNVKDIQQIQINAPTTNGASVLHIAASTTGTAGSSTGTDITDSGTQGGLVIRNDYGITATNAAGTNFAPVAGSTGSFTQTVQAGTTGSPTAITANGLTGVLKVPTINAGSITTNNGNVLIQGGYGLEFDPLSTGTPVGGWYVTGANQQWMQAINGINVVTTGEMRANNLTALNNVYVGTITGANVGGACSALTTTGSGDAVPITKSSASDELLQCRNGFWSPLGMTTTVVTAPSTTTSAATFSIAACPAHTTMTGGGYTLNSFVSNGTTGANAPDQSYPNAAANSWYVRGSSVSASAFTAYAVCAY